MKRLLPAFFLALALAARGDPPPYHSEDHGKEENLPTIFNQMATHVHDGNGTAPLARGRKYAILTDEKASGTNGGGFTSGGWVTRTLNTGSIEIPGASLVASTITLPAGLYEARIFAPACRVDRHQALLRDLTNSVNVVRGSSEFSGNAGDYACSSSQGTAVFSLDATTELVLWHRCQTTFATYGLGIAGSFTTEQYSFVEIWKLED